jgi:hypothetical protein
MEKNLKKLREKRIALSKNTAKKTKVTIAKINAISAKQNCGLTLVDFINL